MRLSHLSQPASTAYGPREQTEVAVFADNQSPNQSVWRLLLEIACRDEADSSGNSLLRIGWLESAKSG